MGYRCKSKLELKLLNNALADCNTAIELDRYNAYTLTKRARVNYDLNKFEDSVSDYKNSLKYDNDNNTILYSNYMLVYINLYKLKNYEEAALYSKKVIELDSSKYTGAHYVLASSLYHLKNCDYIEAGKKYLSICENEKCHEPSVKWINGAIAQAGRNGC